MIRSQLSLVIATRSTLTEESTVPPTVSLDEFRRARHPRPPRRHRAHSLFALPFKRRPTAGSGSSDDERAAALPLPTAGGGAPSPLTPESNSISSSGQRPVEPEPSARAGGPFVYPGGTDPKEAA